MNKDVYLDILVFEIFMIEYYYLKIKYIVVGFFYMFKYKFF